MNLLDLTCPACGCEELIEPAKRLREENARLHVAMSRYGDHLKTHTCPAAYEENGECVGMECICGFWEACGQSRVQRWVRDPQP